MTDNEPRTFSTALTPEQQARVDRARAILGEPRPAAVDDLAARIGRLEWHVGELLSVIVQMADEHPADVTSIARKYGG